MKKNSKIQFWIETDAKSQINKKAIEEGLTFSEYCRTKLIGNSRLVKIEEKLSEIASILGKKLNIQSGG